jgi:hypothetical protein
MVLESHEPALVRFMSCLNGHERAKDCDFSQDELGPVKPIDVKRRTCHRAHGTPDPGLDDHPVFARSGSLELWKKAISFCMPNKLMSWNALAQVGNPAKSIEVNNLIKAVKKKEVRELGKASTARRALTHLEFRRLLGLLKAEDQDDMRRHGLPAFFVFQCNLIARVDDSSRFLAENLKDTPDFDFVLRSKLSWSKNAHEEREAPNQILIGSMDFDHCVLLDVAVHLETFLASALQGGLTPCVFGFSEDITVPKGADKTKKRTQKVLHDETFCLDEFADRGRLGTHSTRKFAAAHRRKNGCTKEEKDLRGRWKRSKNVSNVCDDVDLPHPDAKVAGRLCMGGPCKCVVKEGSGIADNFLLKHVVPNVRTRRSDGVAKVLGKALLWLIFTPDGDHLPHALRERVRTACDDVARLLAGENPIKKIRLFISGDEGELCLDN